MQPREAGGAGGKNPEKIALEITEDQLNRVPDDLIDEKAHESTFKLAEDAGLMKSLGTALSQGMARFKKKLRALRKSLYELQRAIKGIIAMTPELGDMFSALQNNQVSALFEKVGYTSLRLLTPWFADLNLRVEFFCDWVEHGAPVAYWISAYYFP